MFEHVKVVVDGVYKWTVLLVVLIAIIIGAWETYQKHEQKNQEEKG